MKLFRLTLVTILVICLCACEKDNDVFNINCGSLVAGRIFDKNSDIVRDEINKLTADLEPRPTKDDKIGHRQNFDILISRINDNCDKIRAHLMCYACITTLPAQTHIGVTVDSIGFSWSRTIDIRTPENDVLSFAGIH